MIRRHTNTNANSDPSVNPNPNPDPNPYPNPSQDASTGGHRHHWGKGGWRPGIYIYTHIKSYIDDYRWMDRFGLIWTCFWGALTSLLGDLG